MICLISVIIEGREIKITHYSNMNRRQCGAKSIDTFVLLQIKYTCFSYSKINSGFSKIHRKILWTIAVISLALAAKGITLQFSAIGTNNYTKSVTAPREAELTVFAYFARTPRV